MSCRGGVNIQRSKASKDQDREKIEADNNGGKERQERWDLHRPKSPKAYKWPPLYKECEGSGWGTKGSPSLQFKTRSPLPSFFLQSHTTWWRLGLPLQCEFLLRKQQGKKSNGEKAERGVPHVPSPQDYHSGVGTSLLDGAYGERDKLKLWEEGGQKLLNLPD